MATSVPSLPPTSVAQSASKEIAQKYGVDVVLGMMTGVQDYSERMIRAQLERLDDGEYSFEDFCDGDGILSFGQTEDEPIWVRLRVKKHGDSMTIDFAGSDDQVEGPMNAPLAVTASGVYTAVKMIIDPNDLIPANSGTWRAINVLAPEGSVVNVLPPAPVVYANHEMTHRIADMVFGAVAQGYPERALACSQGTSAILTLGGQDPRTGQRYVSYETLGGGMGARPNQDGINAVKAGISNTMNTPGGRAGDALPSAGGQVRNRPRQRWRRRVPWRLRGASRLARGGPHRHRHHLLRAHQVATLRPAGRPRWRAHQRPRSRPSRQPRHPQQQGPRLPRPRRLLHRLRRSRLRRLRRPRHTATPPASTTTSSTATCHRKRRKRSMASTPQPWCAPTAET